MKIYSLKIFLKLAIDILKLIKELKNDKLVIRSFQQHYLPQNVSGK